MGVYARPDSKYFWLHLERLGQAGVRERTRVLNKPENRALAEDVYRRRMEELARGQYFPPAAAPVRQRSRTPPKHFGWCYVYFVWDGSLVKIGRAVNVVARVRAMQSGHPRRLQLLAALPCHVSLEKLIHRYFAEANEAGEWFRPVPELVRFIESVVEGRDAVSKLVNHSLNVHVSFAVFKKEAENRMKESDS